MWLKLDDGFADHPKVMAAGPSAAWLHVAALCYSARHLTDGHIQAEMVGQLTQLKDVARLTRKLVACGLWHVVDGGYVLHDYLDYNPSRADVLRRREHDRVRKESARHPNGIQAVSAKFPRAPSPTPSPTPLTTSHVAEIQSENSQSAAVIARVLAAAEFVSGDVSDVERLVERSLELVPTFDARAGPREAELFARFGWRTPPRDWYRAWLNWIKRAADKAATIETPAEQHARYRRLGWVE